MLHKGDYVLASTFSTCEVLGYRPKVKYHPKHTRAVCTIGCNSLNFQWSLEIFITVKLQEIWRHVHVKLKA